MNDDDEVMFALEMAELHDIPHQALALRTWLPRIKIWYERFIQIRAEWSMAEPGMVMVPSIELMVRESINSTMAFYDTAGVKIEGNPSFCIQAASDIEAKYRAMLSASPSHDT